MGVELKYRIQSGRPGSWGDVDASLDVAGEWALEGDDGVDGNEDEGLPALLRQVPNPYVDDASKDVWV
jgi:hypothetical protein